MLDTCIYSRGVTFTFRALKRHGVSGLFIHAHRTREILMRQRMRNGVWKKDSEGSISMEPNESVEYRN